MFFLAEMYFKHRFLTGNPENIINKGIFVPDDFFSYFDYYLALNEKDFWLKRYLQKKPPWINFHYKKYQAKGKRLPSRVDKKKSFSFPVQTYSFRYFRPTLSLYKFSKPRK